MNKLFVDDLVEMLDTCTSTGITICGQKDILSKLKELDLFDKFPMISYEHTEDSTIEVDVSESKFLNDSSHQGTWIYGVNWDDEIEFIINLQGEGNILYIDTIEINVDDRRQGFGERIVHIIENVACNYFDYISVSPFDTDAMNFWNHMEYVEDERGNWVFDLTK